MLVNIFKTSKFLSVHDFNAWSLHILQVYSNPLMSGFESPAQGLEMDGELGMDLSHHNYADMLGMNEGEVNLQTNNNILEHPDGNNVSVVYKN